MSPRTRWVWTGSLPKARAVKKVISAFAVRGQVRAVIAPNNLPTVRHSISSCAELSKRLRV